MTGKADDALKRFYFFRFHIWNSRRNPHRARSEHVKNRSRLYGIYDLGEDGMNISRELAVLAMPTLYQDAAARAQQPAQQLICLATDPYQNGQTRAPESFLPLRNRWELLSVSNSAPPSERGTDYAWSTSCRCHYIVCCIRLICCRGADG